MLEPSWTLLAAVDEAWGLGLNGGLAWRLPDDLRRLRLLTMGHIVLMGRTTAQGLGRLLPGRASIILTRSPGYTPHQPQDDATPPACVALGIEGAQTLARLRIAQGWPQEIFVLGGGEVYRAMVPLASRALLTLVPGRHGCDVACPELDLACVRGWQETAREQGPLLAVDGQERRAWYSSWTRG